MDDLSGLDWNTTPSNIAKSPTTTNPAYSYPTLRPTPSPSNSGRSTPQAAFQSFNNASRTTPKVLSKSSTPVNDSFAGLLSGGGNKVQNNLSLQERQKQLQQEKARQEAEKKSKLDSHYGSQHGAFWDGLGNRSGASSGMSTPGLNSISPPPGAGLSSTINKPFAGINGSAQRKATQSPEVDEILAAFNSSAPVDASSHFPPPQTASSGRNTPASSSATSRRPEIPASGKEQFDFADDDDPFGLTQMKQNSTSPASPPPPNDDEDILGMLGKPVSEIPKPKPAPVERIAIQANEWVAEQEDELPKGPADKAVAELVDMGFPANKAAIALAQTESGTDVQGAVGILLNQAHEEAKQRSQTRHSQPERAGSAGPDEERRSRPPRAPRDSSVPSWMREEDERTRSNSRTKDNQSPAPEKDVTKYAQDIGSTLFKSANSLWKTSQKKVQKAVAEFQQDTGDPSQPKWMREAQLREEAESQGDLKKGKSPVADVTDEAAMLESGAGRPSKAAKQAPPRASHNPFQGEKPRMPSPSIDSFSDRASPQPRMQQRSAHQMPPGHTQKLTRQDVEEQAAEVIISSSRRRRPAPQQKESSSAPPKTGAIRAPINSPPVQSRNPFANGSKPATPNPVSRPSSVPVPTRPKAPPRNIPQVSPSALSISASHRQNGSEAFKRGDYSAAHTHYSSALRGIPTGHPVTIIIMCNRALTNIKVGDPKAAVSDAESALATIGISRGEGEKIAAGGTEGEKDMKEFYGKALMRKAEALEHMEKWDDAAKVWRDAVETGVGGNISIQGRNRCEKASGSGASARSDPVPRPAAARKPQPPKPRSSALADLNSGTASQHEAVNKLREANAAAEKADDEKFALTDVVDAKLVAWKGTKSDNIRALLGSLDKVLWEGAGWNKVGMQDLVMPNKVKICYMKAIAKVHPDKISPNATTEQRMISASVFSTLNEAWDKFKKDNNL
ncbi:hypothetical protein FKW77_008077 [Venturia effusa]|uniref:UBA domain-containing protein n=1 Tax=Venturia effusa TaxID=50376 RepID=A0A517KZV0_9PEZI|nr:hypothetical protein FKW77_008077 [Venturia effusa]